MSKKFISCNKCTILVGTVDNVGNNACVGSGAYGKSLCIPLNVAEPEKERQIPTYPRVDGEVCETCDM